MQIFKRNFNIGLTALAAACLMAPAWASADPSIINGSLEQQTNHGKTADGAMDFSVYPDNWNLLVPGGESWSSLLTIASPDGGKYWGSQYLVGHLWNGTPMVAAGGISQTVNNLTIGQTYQISFYSMANYNSDPKVSAYWQVGFGSSTLNGNTVYPGPTDADGVWSQSKLNFVATSTSQTLSFAAAFLGTTPGLTPAVLNIDGISIAAVPEPSTLGLMLAGFTALGLCARRRRSA
ncbi:MAG TPA: PEP-CTERM sorting domain-containing protein [Burkholderiaceae bacterium]